MIVDEEFDFYFDGQPQGKATEIETKSYLVYLHHYKMMWKWLKIPRTGIL